MTSTTIFVRASIALIGTVLLGACMNQPPEPRHPGPYAEPVDAFNAVDTPYDPNGGPMGTDRQLSDDIAHLREARRAYEHSQDIQAAERRTRQAQCRDKPGAKLVRIQDGSGDPDAVYCQMPVDDNRGDADDS